MGSCFSLSSTNSTITPSTAKVVALDGSLKQYSTSITVSSVLGPNHKSCFVCSSDSLYFDAYIPALALESMLELNQIYFVLPVSRLEYPLSGSDMAELAIKACSVLARASSKKKRGERQRIRIVPVAQVVCDMACVGDDATLVKSSTGKRPRTRARTAFRAKNRERLDTIEEVEE